MVKVNKFLSLKKPLFPKQFLFLNTKKPLRHLSGEILHFQLHILRALARAAAKCGN